MSSENAVATKLIEISRRLAHDVDGVDLPRPACFVYNPLRYAFEAHRTYLERYARGPKPGVRRALLVGMNPGPWGMAQTGIPFGAVSVVRDWLGIEQGVKTPRSEHLHPKRPVLGFDCTREEVSGARLWGWARDTWQTPSAFFERFWITNFCPLLLLDEGGRNVTPDKLPASAQRQLAEPCLEALRGIAETIEIDLAIGIGIYAEKRTREALASSGIEIARILHPSPASPMANRGWASQASAQLRELGVEIPSRS